MLKANAKKIKSALREAGLLAAFIILFGVTAIALWLAQGNTTPNSSQEYCMRLSDGTADCLAKLEPAATNDKRLRGLSGRDSLPDGTGMLFIFDRPSEQCMWMKDMKFSIDMMWLNEKKQIIKLATEVTPETYPSSFCSEDTKYVIELPAGQALKSSLTAGKQLKF